MVCKFCVPKSSYGNFRLKNNVKLLKKTPAQNRTPLNHNYSFTIKNTIQFVIKSLSDTKYQKEKCGGATRCK